MIAEAEAFNVPLVAVAVAPDPTAPGERPPRASFVAADRPNVTVEAVKRADREHAIVVRVSEAWGARSRVRIATPFPAASVMRADLLERDVAPLACVDGMVELDLRPFELVTLKFMRRA